VSNGLKHTEGVVHVTAVRDGGEIVISVRDDGPGIPDQHHEIVFEPFRRLGNHLHRTQGPGLGLAIARSLVEAIGGSLGLAPSREGGGAEFLLRVPHDRVPAARGGHGARSAGAEGVAR
jgi:signal transduction histidine kinase